MSLLEIYFFRLDLTAKENSLLKLCHKYVWYMRRAYGYKMLRVIVWGLV